MKNYLYLSIFTVLFVNDGWSQTLTCPQNSDNPGNRIISQIIGSETITREYVLRIPQNYDDNIPTPLIINLHGFGDCASDYATTIEDFYNFSKLTNEENIIVAYPQGAYRLEKEDTYWEPGDNGLENIFENDVYFIDKLIEDVGAELNLDLNRIYACGYSNGGMMAYSLACNRSNQFSAIGVMSGTMLEEDCTLERSVPIITFHGIEDGVLPYEGNIWYQSVEEVVSFWLDKNNILGSSLNSSQLNEGKVILDRYSEGTNSCLSLYTIYEEYDKPGDHVWFSDDIEGTSPNRIMWDFFEDNCSPINGTKEFITDTFKLYPNPVVDQLEIGNAINLDFSLHDLNGKQVLKGKIKSNAQIINLSILEKGYYTIRIGGQIKKILKI